jgi:hypothetical protein
LVMPSTSTKVSSKPRGHGAQRCATARPWPMATRARR